MSSTNRSAIARLLDRDTSGDLAIERRVAKIVEDVRANGDRAVLRYARRFDRLEGPLELERADLERRASSLPRETVRAIATAARHIRAIARTQVPRRTRTSVVPGVVVEQRAVPLARVGCYVPGGRYPLPSSLLMTALPARVAGVKDIVVVCPSADPAVLAAALEAEVDRFFCVGGAHAIAALAYGTETIPRVDKIAGPGNAYVAAAKRLVSRHCGVDLHAGPSEIVVVSKSGRPEWIAADLVAQAEHDPNARAIFITPSRRLAESVRDAVADALAAVPAAREAIARAAVVVVTRNRTDAIALANAIAPEHAVCDDEWTAKRLDAAGTVFVGPFSAQAAGDYATGSNHVLPTGGAARQRGGLSAADFVRMMNVQRLTRAGLTRLRSTVQTLAQAEGLIGHARSIEVRFQSRHATARRARSRDAR